MALINCPECGKEVSDKASACIHCGCPLKDKNINILGNQNDRKINYPIKINGKTVMSDDIKKFLRKSQKTDAIQYIISETNCNENEALEIIEDIMHMQRLQSENIKSTNISNVRKVKNYNNNILSCPKCGSQNIQIVRRKWTLLAGFATSKVDRVCANCLYKW